MRRTTLVSPRTFKHACACACARACARAYVCERVHATTADLIANRTLTFLANVTAAGTPFFAMAATPACHGPNDQAPQYMETYAGRKSPRTPSWNKAPQPDKHWLLRQIVRMDEAHTNASDIFFQRRWSVLRSVDDMVERFATFLKARGVWDDTFFVFSSDHGYHLGQFGMLYDKRMLYETDIRVPLFARGPDISPGTVINATAVHVDLSPTLLDMMGMPATPTQMDGRSWLPLAQARVREDVSPRSRFLVEYSGGGQPEWAPAWDEHDHNDESSCVRVNSADENGLGGCKASCTFATGDKSPCDGKNNTYACVRTLEVAAPDGALESSARPENTIYCEFLDDEGFVEFYDLSIDPWNLHNLAPTMSKAELLQRSKELQALKRCTGVSCRLQSQQ